MWNVLLIVLFSLLPLIVTLITSPQDIFVQTENKPKAPIFRRNRPWKPSKRGWAFFASVVLTGVFAYLQHHQSENQKVVAKNEARKELERRDSLSRIEQDRRDSVSYKRFDDSKNETIKVLAEYQLGIDSATGRIIRTLKDSINQTVLNGPEPVLEVITASTDPQKIQSEVVEGNMYKITLPLRSNDAGSSKFDIVVHYGSIKDFSSDTNNYQYKYSIHPFLRIPAVEANGGPVSNFVLERIGGINNVWFWVKGTYYTTDGKRKKTIDKIYFHNLKDNTSGVVSGQSFVGIIQAITQRSKKSFFD